MMELNYNTFSFLFNKDCLASHDIDIMQWYDFYSSGSYVRGHIPVENLTTFILDFEDTHFLSDCIIDWSYEYIVPVDTHCEQENTNQIKYEMNNKPFAWQLDMLDNITDASYLYPSYNYSDMVNLWILDTGVFWKHKEFEPGQVIDVDQNYTLVNLTSPHGTGTACAAGGLHYGTSKHVQIYNYPVCRYGGSCGGADIEKGLQTVLAHVKARNLEGKRSVINLSFGAAFPSNPMNSSLGQFYNNLFKEIDLHGGVLVVAAGNANQDACNWLYSYSPFVISVGSIDNVYNKSGFSNWGSCVDIWAFGSNVPIAYSVSDPNIVQYKSGTSFASPLVAGIITNLLIEYPKLNKEELLNYLYNKYRDRIVPRYQCGQNKRQCCQGDLRGTRFDSWCRKHTVYECDRACQVKAC